MLTKKILLDLIEEQAAEITELKAGLVNLVEEVQTMHEYLICTNPERLEKAIADVTEPKRGRGRPKKA